MLQIQLTTIEKHLRQIADMLVLNGILTDCPGLIHGKMGIAIFFFHYAKYTNNAMFENYAFDLLGEMQTQIHVNSQADYEKGIAGIGTGLDYLIKNKFLDADDDIFEDFDRRMYRAVMHDPWQDFSLYDGLTGYGKYWIARLLQQGPSMQARECLLCITERIEEKITNIPVNEQTDVYCFFHDLRQIFGFDNCIRLLKQCKKWELQSVDISKCFPRFRYAPIGNIVCMYQRSRYFNDVLQGEIDIALKQIPDLDMEKPAACMGLLTGYVGEGLLRLTALHQTNMSWMHLL